jgi:hypothetical protein
MNKQDSSVKITLPTSNLEKARPSHLITFCKKIKRNKLGFQAVQAHELCQLDKAS